MNDLLSILESNRGKFERVVPFQEGRDRLVAIDLTTANNDLTAAILDDTALFSAYVSAHIEKQGARYAIGGYNEHRAVYSRSRVFDGKLPGEEPRRLHLGIDIWGKPNTPVIAPMDGLVHSFGHNDQPGDYGATIILTHQLEQVSFYTLYGHLSLGSIKNLREGERLRKGDLFAEFGIPAENGHWPPHLHFQLIRDLEGWTGDYPGVCKLSEREKYLENCPDPDLMLDMIKFTR